MGSDRYAAYAHLDPTGRALCWAHLVRDLQGLSERPSPRGHPTARLVGHWGLEVAADLFDLGHLHRAAGLRRAELQVQAEPLQARFATALRRVPSGRAAGGCAKTAGFCGRLLDQWEGTGARVPFGRATFLRVAGVEPTNHSAERALRPAVLWRKRSSGHQSDSGQVFVERLLSVNATLRGQRRSVLAFLEETLRAVSAGCPSGVAPGDRPPSVLAPASAYPG